MEDQKEKVKELMREQYAHVKQYPSTPMYYVQVDKQACRLLVYIDDILTSYTFIQDYGESMLVPINGDLRSSGKHTCTIQVLPLSSEIYINEKAWVNVRLLYLKDKKDLIRNAATLSEVLELPNDIGSMQKTEWTLSTTFDVTLPFDYSSILKDARDLSTVPDLDRKVVAYYNKIRTFIENCDLYSLVKESMDLWIYGDMYYLDEYNFMLACVGSPEKFDPTLPGRKVLPIENYELVICGNGRLVQLRRKKQLGSVLRVEYFESEEDKLNNRAAAIETTIMLYMPKGGEEFKMLY